MSLRELKYSSAPAPCCVHGCSGRSFIITHMLIRSEVSILKHALIGRHDVDIKSYHTHTFTFYERSWNGGEGRERIAVDQVLITVRRVRRERLLREILKL